MDNRIHLIWAGGEHDFALGIGELRALQQQCNAGPEEVLMRILDGKWRIDDLVQTIRLGLVGSGAFDAQASIALVDGLLSAHPPMRLKQTALAVLSVALMGVEGDQPGEQTGARAAAPENGRFPTSTAPVQ
jgi:hypothetical protein